MKSRFLFLLLAATAGLSAQTVLDDELILIPRIFGNYTLAWGPDVTGSNAGVFASEWRNETLNGSGGFGFELGFRKYLSENVALETGLGWMQSGYLVEYSKVRTEREDTLFISEGRFDFRNSYLRIPLTILGEFEGQNGFYIQGGTYFGLLTGQGGDYLVSRRTFIDPETGIELPSPEDENFATNSPSRSLDVGGLVGLGIHRAMSSGNYLNICLRGWVGFQPFWNEADLKQAGGELVIGYGFGVQ